MATYSETITFATKGNRDIVDITPAVQAAIAKSHITDGIALAFSPGSTGAITTIEYEPGLLADMDRFLERLLPYKDRYRHHETWHDDNGAAHVQAALIGPSVALPLVDGALVLGTWQQIIFIDCDTRPRNRRVIVQVAG